eukprot:NODE_371_length_9954_cov_0.100355.p9 type:complete len:116 gc:universal NODE_371_length_9954_cov_0.100355:4322-3975(-)
MSSSDSSFSSTFSSSTAAALPAADGAAAEPEPLGTLANLALPAAISSATSLPLSSEITSFNCSSSISAPTAEMIFFTFAASGDSLPPNCANRYAAKYFMVMILFNSKMLCFHVFT